MKRHEKYKQLENRSMEVALTTLAKLFSSWDLELLPMTLIFQLDLHSVKISWHDKDLGQKYLVQK